MAPASLFAPAIKAVGALPLVQLPTRSAAAVVVLPRRALPAVLAVPAHAVGIATKAQRRGAALVAAAGAVDDGDLRPATDDEYPEGGGPSGEWPADYSSLLSTADLRAYLESRILASDKMSPSARLMDVMSRPVRVATPGQRLAEIDGAAHQHSGMLPVVDGEGRCVGVVSKEDRAKATNGMESTTVGEVMSAPAITLTHDKTVLDAAALMLKEKVRRIPVVNEQQYVIGIITRTDIFQALEANKP